MKSALFGRYIIKKHNFKDESALVETVVASSSAYNDIYVCSLQSADSYGLGFALNS